jgi:hypothetical protein
VHIFYWVLIPVPFVAGSIYYFAANRKSRYVSLSQFGLLVLGLAASLFLGITLGTNGSLGGPASSAQAISFSKQVAHSSVYKARGHGFAGPAAYVGTTINSLGEGNYVRSYLASATPTQFSYSVGLYSGLNRHTEWTCIRASVTTMKAAVTTGRCGR